MSVNVGPLVHILRVHKADRHFEGHSTAVGWVKFPVFIHEILIKKSGTESSPFNAANAQFARAWSIPLIPDAHGD